MTSTKIEFLVEMTCDSCVDAVKKSLDKVPGIHSVEINLQQGYVVVDSSLSTLDVLKRLETTGRKVAIKGYDGSLAAVSILQTPNNSIMGVVRLIQALPNTCIIDGTVDGLKPGAKKLTVHEFGDISQGCESVGDIYNPSHLNNDRIYGDLGIINADIDGRANFRLEDNILKVRDVIGRSMCISEKQDDSWRRIVCGIIARSSGLFQNPKKICPCDGVSIWDEVSKPKKRQQNENGI